MITGEKWRGKRVLVTGATGFVGANLVRRLLAEKADVYVLTRDAASAWRLEGIRERVTVLSGDLGRLADVQAAMDQANPVVVFHMATVRAGNAQPDYAQFVAINTMGAHHLLAAARANGVERLISAGSQLEYGPSLKPHCETDCLQPDTYHGMTKGAASVYLQAAGRKGNPATVTLRLFHVYGPWESPKRLIPTAIRAVSGGTLLRMTPRGIRRDYVYVGDVVEAFLMAADLPGIGGGIFNIGSGIQTSNEEVVMMVGKLCGKPLSVEFDAYAPHATDTTYRVADIEKAGKVLGWKPATSLEQGLKATIEWVATYDREHGQT